MPDADDGCLSGSVKILLSVGGIDPTAIAADCLRIVLEKTSRKKK